MPAASAGVMKNALDWLVGSFEFPNKPVALINTSPRATHALGSFDRHAGDDVGPARPRRVDHTASARHRNDAESIAANAELAAPLRSALERYVRAITTFAGEEQ